MRRGGGEPGVSKEAKQDPFTRGKTRNGENVGLREKDGSNLADRAEEREMEGGKDQIRDGEDRKTSCTGRKGGI